MPTVTVVTDVFAGLGREVTAALGYSGAMTSVIAHPLGGLKRSEVEARSRKALPAILRQLSAPQRAGRVRRTDEGSKAVSVGGSPERATEHFYRQGWTDGLPIVLPVRDKVEQMMALCRRKPDEVVGIVAPKMGMATVEKIAVNAVMAGCEAGYLPVLLAAVEAVCRPEFNLLPMQATTNPVTPMLIINGPIVKKLALNPGYNVLGPGWKSNATIGRALRFVLNNIGGATPGRIDKACHGQPGKYSMCIAELEEANPWQPFHVERGYARRDSTVSVIGVTGTQDIIHYARTSARKVLDTIVRAIPREGYKNLYSGGEPLVMLGPEQAAILGDAGLSKSEVKRIIFEGTQVPVKLFNPETLQLIRGRRPRCFSAAGKADKIPLADRAEDIQIIVAGGAGNHSVFMPTWGDTRCVTVKI